MLMSYIRVDKYFGLRNGDALIQPAVYLVVLVPEANVCTLKIATHLMCILG